MNYYRDRIVPIDYNKLWADSLKQEDGNYPERIRNDEVEKKFWKEFIKKKVQYKQDENAKIVMKEVEKILAEYKLENILEIGPGWGNYTLELSKHCEQLTCLDLSEDILTYIKKVTQTMGINNIDTINSKVEDVDVTHQYDGVFGYNCFYRIKDLKDCLKKIDSMSRKISIVGMGMGETPQYYKEMEEKIGVQIQHEKKDYIHFVNILYSMGVDPNVKVIPLEKEVVYSTWEELIINETTRLKDPKMILANNRDLIEEILKQYFKEDEEGKIRWKYKFRGALIYWTPKNSAKRL